MFLELFVDPSVIFCVSCILTPLWVARDRINAEDVKEYFLEPSMLAALVAIPLCWIIGLLLRHFRMKRLVRQQKLQQSHLSQIPESQRINYDILLQPLSYGERTRARWYLLNGIIIHMLMDGSVGVFKTSKLFAENYAKLDRRYGEPLGSFIGSTVHVVSLVEMLIKGPICIFLYWSFVTRHASRDALEFFTCVTQAYGTIVYLGQELVSGGTNLDVDYGLTFSPHFLLYFWFAIFFGCLLYLIVPTILGIRSYQRLMRQCRYAMEHSGVRGASSSSNARTKKVN